MRKLAFILLAVVSLTFFACNSSTSDSKNQTPAQSSGLAYVCPMDPEVISDKPGKCPKCKMELVLKNQVEEDHTGHNH